jgi:transposase InsO family protein
LPLDKQKGVRGSQYCSIEYQAELRKNGISISMSGKGNCFDNAMVETFFKTLKGQTRLAHHLPEPSAAIRRSTSSARFSSKGGQRKIENALHKCRASPRPVGHGEAYARVARGTTGRSA